MGSRRARICLHAFVECNENDSDVITFRLLGWGTGLQRKDALAEDGTAEQSCETHLFRPTPTHGRNTQTDKFVRWCPFFVRPILNLDQIRVVWNGQKQTLDRARRPPINQQNQLQTLMVGAGMGALLQQGHQGLQFPGAYQMNQIGGQGVFPGMQQTWQGPQFQQYGQWPPQFVPMPGIQPQQQQQFAPMPARFQNARQQFQSYGEGQSSSYQQPRRNLVPRQKKKNKSSTFAKEQQSRVNSSEKIR